MLRDLLALSHVPRWTTHPMGRPQSVAEHSFNTAAIVNYLYTTCWPEDDSVFMAVFLALVHDGPEAKIGDIPSPVKAYLDRNHLRTIEHKVCPWAYGTDDMGNELSWLVVELADCLEGFRWASLYGNGTKDHFDGLRVDTKLETRIRELASKHREVYPQLYSAVLGLLEEFSRG